MKQKKWKKRGLIFKPSVEGWMATHAQNPLPEDLGNGKVRVHFASRDSQNRSRAGYFECSMENPLQILNISKTPLLDLGELGTFDDSGVMPSSILSIKGRKHLYYTGWSRTVDVPFAFHIGLAIE